MEGENWREMMTHDDNWRELARIRDTRRRKTTIGDKRPQMTTKDHKTQLNTTKHNTKKPSKPNKHPCQRLRREEKKKGGTRSEKTESTQRRGRRREGKGVAKSFVHPRPVASGWENAKRKLTNRRRTEFCWRVGRGKGYGCVCEDERVQVCPIVPDHVHFPTCVRFFLLYQSFPFPLPLSHFCSVFCGVCAAGMASGGNAGTEESGEARRDQFDAGKDVSLNYGDRVLREGSRVDREKGMSAAELLRLGLRGSQEEYEHSAETLHHNPCFRQALLWGIGLGLLFGVHRFKETGNPMKFVDWAIGGWFGVSLTSWLVCRRNDMVRISAMQEWYDDRTSGQLDAKIEEARREFYAAPPQTDTDPAERS